MPQKMYNGAGKDAQLEHVFRKLSAAEFEPFIRFLERELRDVSDTLENATDSINLYRAQGRGAILRRILETIARHRS